MESNNWKQRVLLVGFLFALSVTLSLPRVYGEDTKIRVKAGELGATSVAADDQNHILEAGDRVRIKIYPEDQYIKGGEMDVSSEGNITLSLVGKVPVAGLNLVDAERELARIIDADYLVNPEVVVELISAKKTVYNISILGQVKKPGSYEIETSKPELFLLEAISTAGGFSDVANIKKIKIMRKEDGKNKIIHANAESIIGGKDPDVLLKEGDVVHVSESFF